MDEFYAMHKAFPTLADVLTKAYALAKLMIEKADYPEEESEYLWPL